MDFFSAFELNAFTVFLAIAAAGFLFLLLSLFFGGIFDHFDGGFDHDVDHGGPGFFSTRVISVFVTAFGGFGAIATYYGFGPLPASGDRVRWRAGVRRRRFSCSRGFSIGQQASSESLARRSRRAGRPRRRRDSGGRRRSGPLPGRRGADRQDRPHAPAARRFPRTRPCGSKKCSAKPSSSSSQ